MQNEDILWRFDDHTKAKHEILKKYIEAWVAILTQSINIGRVVYIDGFAGPGESIDHEPGSPLIALDSIINHKLFKKFKSEIILLFIEKDPKRKEHLEELLRQKFSNLPKKVKYEVIEGEFNDQLSRILNSLDENQSKLAPTFCFVDPFGWSDLNLDVLARFMMQDKAELLITFMAGFIKRFIESPSHYESLKHLFTDDQINELKNSSPTTKGEKALQFFLENLKNKINKEVYSISFETRNKTNNLEYYLIYLTSNVLGMKVMKDAMYNVSENGEFKFSDFDFNPSQKTLVDYGLKLKKQWIKDATNELCIYISNNALINKEIPLEEVEKYIILYTHYAFRKEILKYLESTSKIDIIGERKRKYTYPDNAGIKIKFKNC
ncbi:MAG: three-Cys-motif partner protein TcmP [Candidatus Nanopusillus acidilobi]